jgi:hypothetical protein
MKALMEGDANADDNGQSLCLAMCLVSAFRIYHVLSLDDDADLESYDADAKKPEPEAATAGDTFAQFLDKLPT